MTFERLIACALVLLAVVASAASSAADQAAVPPSDHVLALAATWSCRSAEGVRVRSAGVRRGDAINVHDDVVDATGKQSSFDDRYTFDPAQQRWHVVSGLGGFHADASPWTNGTWTVQGEDANHVGGRMTLELLPNGDMRRSFFDENSAAVFALQSVELCTPGSTPPPPDACIVPKYPARTLEAAPVNGRFIPRSAYPGLVQIIISLNERSEVVGARVQSSTSDVLNGPALAAARASTFRTAIVNCKPVAADYVFSVIFDAD
jgi:hypothetical protein